MLEINNLIYSYDNKKNVLNGSSFTIEKGKIYCLLGVNGAGKTTLFKCISGLYTSNINIDKNIINEKILYIHDNMYFYKKLTGIEFINLIVSLKKKDIDKKFLSILINDLKMNEYIDKIIATYSLGTKQKLVMIIAFLLEYEYILMDEPFSSLDFIASEMLINTMKKYVNKNCSIMVSTHLIDIAQQVADNILFLNNGKINQIKNNFKDSKEIKDWIKELIKLDMNN
ncbi:ATP-binding cassette domain-containing protein [Clostridium sp. FAM 1755]|uniref:ATP-binding cassette domain-containing protein n=1 Tax=Clostridium caseinilyticum TaxID=3350403 RepID=UPI003592D8B5